MIPDLSKDNLEDIRELERAIKGSNFRFIILQYNHRSVLSFLENRLHTTFPQKKITETDLREATPQSLLSTIQNTGKGIIFLHHFDSLLNDATFAVFFNQRRDMLSELPVQLIACLPTGTLYLRKVVERIPDMWSLRNLTLQLEIQTQKSGQVQMAIHQAGTLGGENLKEKKKKSLPSKKELLPFPKLNKIKDYCLVYLTNYNNCMKMSAIISVDWIA